jgi:Short-chain alcohol dehydrogenase of unknown specificity
MPYDFSGRTVIVTGASSGIGARTAQLFGEYGANVVLAARREDRLQETAATMVSDRTLIQTADVADRQSVDALIKASVERFGGVDVLVNNAGTAELGKIDELSQEDWDRLMQVNVSGVFYGVQAALPHLRKRPGNIVNVSSVSGLGGDWGLAGYNASKGAVTNFTRSLALELGREGIRVNAVNPSLVYTEMSEGVSGNEELLAKFDERMPLGKGAQPIDVARVIAFLASDDAGFVNGVNLPVDGGVTAANGQPPLMG